MENVDNKLLKTQTEEIGFTVYHLSLYLLLPPRMIYDKTDFSNFVHMFCSSKKTYLMLQGMTVTKFIRHSKKVCENIYQNLN